MRCDLHVHSIHSGPCTLPVLKSFCRESYCPAEAVYERLTRLGMDLVTITDHDSIDGCQALRHFRNFFISEEVTCQMPSGTELHVGVYDITEAQHLAIQRRRDDLPRLVAYLEEQNLFFCVNHAFSSLTGRREREDFDCLEELFVAYEVRNGAIPAANNLQAKVLAKGLGGAPVAGSDAHTLTSLGSVYTEVAGVRDRQEFLRGLRLGRGRARGQSGSYWKLTRDVFLIALAMMEERPVTLLFAPVALGIPVATLAVRVREEIFVRHWRRKLAIGFSLPRGLASRRVISESEGAVV